MPYTEGIRAWGAYFYYSEVAAYVIKGNEITVGGSPGGWGIYVDWALAPVVGDNRIHLSSPAEAGILLWDVANATVVDNDFAGSGEYGLVLGHPQFPRCCFNDSNTLKDNNLVDFTASVADYYLGIDVTNNILHVEEEDLVLDESGNETNIIIRGRCAGCRSSSPAEMPTASRDQAAQQVIGWETKRGKDFRMLYGDLAQ